MDNKSLCIKLSTISMVQCRICYDSDKDEPLIAPCQCKGTVAFVHCSCLERWLAESNTTTCELCHDIIRTERTPKYTSLESIWKWIRYHGEERGVRSDIVACTIITPLAVVVTYICLFSSDYYNQKKFDLFPSARWTSLSLLIMIVIMLTGYYMWVYSVIRVQSRLWYNWWQRECVVKYIPNNCSSTSSMISIQDDTTQRNNTPIEDDSSSDGFVSCVVVVNPEDDLICT